MLECHVMGQVYYSRRINMIRKTAKKSARPNKSRHKPKPLRDDAVHTKAQNGRARKVHPAVALIDEWLKDESGYDEETWPILKKAIEEDRARIGARRLFDD